MCPPPPDNFFNKFKEKTQQAGKQVGLVAKITKLKLEISTQKAEKENYLKTIGSKTYAIFSKDKSLDGQKIQNEITNELSLIERIDKHVEELEREIENLQADFRTAEGKDYVDASDVKDAGDH